MKKSSILFICLLLNTCFSVGQSSVYDFVKPGNAQIGVADTIIYDTRFNYHSYGYNGPMPQFVKVWFPLPANIANPEFLTLADFYKSDSSDTLARVQAELNRCYREAIIRDCLEENLITGTANEFGGHSYADVLNLLGTIKTRCIARRMSEKMNAPVILYHHGAQSSPFENYLMAEYFVSRGYIFIAANFHLPYEQYNFGSRPYGAVQKGEDEAGLLNLLKFAQRVSSNAPVYFIGHSYGAQMGFRTFDDNTAIKGMISLETTIEFKEDTNKIKEMWPEVYQKVIVENAVYPFPVLLCAATGKKEPFTFFKDLKSKSLTFASTKEQFEHNAYTSLFYLRYFLDIHQPDKEVLLDRLQIYIQHLEMIEKFLGRINSKENLSESEVLFLK